MVNAIPQPGVGVGVLGHEPGHAPDILLYTFIYLQIPPNIVIYLHILQNIQYSENEGQHKTQK